MYVKTNDEKPAQVLSIPEKARACLLDYLSVWELMNLRQVCKTTKSWVEDSYALRKLVIHVKGRYLLKKLIKSRVKWSNLRILCDNSDLTSSWIRSKDYMSTFAKLNTSLKVLTLSEHRLQIYGGLDLILSHCTGLEKLQIGTLDLKNATLPVAGENNTLQNLQSLTHLSVIYIAWEKELDLQFLSHLFKACGNLVFLRMPYVLTASLYSLYPSLEEDAMDQKAYEFVDNLLFSPIIANLLLISPERRCLKYLDVENFDLSQLLEKIVPACQQCGCLLLNVVESLEEPLGTKDKDCLSETIGSLLSCTKSLDLTTLCRLQSINITEDYVPLTDLDKKYEEAALPALKNIGLTMTSKPILPSARLASCFLHQKRDSVHTVRLDFGDLSGAAQTSVFKIVQFTSCFPSLRSLSLGNFDGKSDHYLLIWKSFPLLERLILQNCLTLDDYSFVGEDDLHPTFLNLKRLKELTLEDGAITNTTIQLVISRLSLHWLSLAIPQVTFQGLSLLSAGGLRTSLMVLHCMKPDDCSEENFKQFFMSFENLKKHEIIF